MINERKRKELEEKAGEKINGLQEKNPNCTFRVVVYESGTREGEVVVQKEKPDGEITDFVIGSAQDR